MKLGEKLWEFETGSHVGFSPAISSDGTVYVGSDDKKLYAINPDGTKKWSLEIGGDGLPTPAIGFDGTVYVGGGNKLYGINPAGAKKWTFETEYPHMSDSYPSISADGTVYVGGGTKLYAINPDSTKKWAFETVDSVYSSPVVGADGTVYLGAGNKLYAVNSGGTKKWAFETVDSVSSSPAVGSDGTVYMGSWDYNVYAVNSDGTKKWAFQTGGAVRSSPAIGSDGTVYVGSDDNKLYALKTDSNGPAQSPWPMRGQNAQRTGLSPYSSDSNNSETKPEETANEVETDLGYAQDLGHHWYRSSWLGDYWDGNASWIYHLQLGWLYHHKDQSSSSLWLYSPGLGWLWTKESIGRYLYSYSRRGWFALRGASGSPALYDFRLSAWKSREGDAWIGEVSEQLFLSGLFTDDVPRGNSSRQVVVEAGTRLEGDPGPALTGQTVIFENDVTVTGTLTIR